MLKFELEEGINELFKP